MDKPNLENNKFNNSNRSIQLYEIIKESALEHKALLWSTFFVICSYWLQDVYFSNKISELTTNIDGFISDISIKKILIFFAPNIVSEIMYYAYNIVSAKTIPNIKLSIANKLTDQVIESIKTSKKQIDTTELIINIKKTAYVEQIHELFVANILPTALIGLGILHVFYKASPMYCVHVLVIIFVFMLILSNLNSPSGTSSHAVEESIGQLFESIHETTSNVDTVITSNCINKELANLDKSKQKATRCNTMLEIHSSNMLLQATFFNMTLLMILIGYAIYLYSKKKITVQSVASICIMAVLFFQYCNTTFHKIKNSMQYIGILNDLNNYFSEFNIDTTKKRTDFKIESGEIELNNVSLVYKNKVVFKNLSLSFVGGHKTVIIGPNGTGKSSLLKMIAGVIKYNGQINIDDQDIKNYQYEHVINNIAYIQQQPKLFNRSLYENLNYGCKYTEAEVNMFVDKLNLTDFFNEFPDKLQTVAGKEGRKLSGGQRQIISIVRSLLQNKKILLLDEPTSAIDDNIKHIFINLMNNIKNKTVIIITHDKTIYGIGDYLIDMKDYVK